MIGKGFQEKMALREQRQGFRMKWLPPIIAAWLTLSSGPAGAAGLGGELLYQLCKSSYKDERAICAMYVGGVADAWTVVSAVDQEEKIDLSVTGFRAYCDPGDITNAQRGELFAKWMDEHPERRQDQATSMVIDAIADIFPCSD
jgi:hypothetical protein